MLCLVPPGTTPSFWHKYSHRMEESVPGLRSLTPKAAGQPLYLQSTSLAVWGNVIDMLTMRYLLGYPGGHTCLGRGWISSTLIKLNKRLSLPAHLSLGTKWVWYLRPGRYGIIWNNHQIILNNNKMCWVGPPTVQYIGKNKFLAWTERL